MSIFWNVWVALLLCIFLTIMATVVYYFWSKNNKADKDRTLYAFDGVKENDAAIPRIIFVTYVLLGIYALVFFLLYPGVAGWQGLMSWQSSDEAHWEHSTSLNELMTTAPKNASLQQLSQQADIVSAGHSLFQTHCAACHRDKGQGQLNFPDLTDNVWLYGGSDEQILQSIHQGRHGLMAGWSNILSSEQISQVAYYVASLQQVRVLDVSEATIGFGKTVFTKNCSSCHGENAKGDISIGAANLTDGIWLHGGSVMDIISTVSNGIDSLMPAFNSQLSNNQILAMAAFIKAQENKIENRLAKLNKAQVSRGSYLAKAGDCNACHSVPNGEAFAGGLAFNTPLGSLYSVNISTHPDFGIGEYTKEEFSSALRKGKGKHGYLYPAMPYTSYQYINDADIGDLWAYMQTLPSVPTANKANNMMFPANIRLGILGWNLVFFDTAPLSYPDNSSEAWRRGKYLTLGLGHCAECHTPRNFAQAMEAKNAFQGNVVDGWEAPDITANELYQEGWTIDSLAKFLKTGHSKTGAAFAGMSDVVKNSTQFLQLKDLQAIAEYVLTGDKYNELDSGLTVRKASGFNKQSMQLPEYHVFAQTCGACHGEDGLGRQDIAPSLLDNGIIMQADPYDTVAVAIRGLSPDYISAAQDSMPMESFANVLNDKQLATLVSFVRLYLGANHSPVTSADVTEIREKLAKEGYTSPVHQAAKVKPD